MMAALVLMTVVGGVVDSVLGEQCNRPLGLESGEILNAQLSASSSYEINSVGPFQARLNNNNGGGAWCPKSFISESSGVEEFLEIDLGVEHTVTGVVTQGRFANGLGQEFAELFLLQYWTPGMEDFHDYVDRFGTDIFTGNRDTYTEAETALEPPMIASRVRIIPFSYHPRTVCMRVELKGCRNIISDSTSSTTSTPWLPELPGTNLKEESYEILDQVSDVAEKEEQTTEGGLVDVDLSRDLPDHEVVVLEPWWETEYMGVAVGVLVTVILVLIVIIVFILYKNYKSPAYPDTAPYYESNLHQFEHHEPQWPDRKLTISRKLPPTPSTSEEHYTDSSVEYSSPLLHQVHQSHQDIRWENFFPTQPAAGTQPRVVCMKPVNHYAATDVINPGGGKSFGKRGLTYFL